MRSFLSLLVLAALTATAAEPGPAPVSAAPAPTAASGPAAAGEAQPAAAATAPVDGMAAPQAVSGAAEPFRPPSGYRKKTRGGETVYCRKETPVGTRFPTEYCFTQADLERIEKNQKSIQQDHSLRTKMCTTGAACGGG